jgi:methionyl-tRNA formyltransferase
MKIAFFGTPGFTTQFLDKLVEAELSPALVVTGPDVPVGRGMTLTAPEPKVWAQAHNIRVLQPQKLTTEVIDEIAAESWDLFVVIAYGKIIPERLITVPKYGTINVHYSLLPKYRGASPVESALMNGDTETGVCIQQMCYKLDTGPIIAEQVVPITPDDNTLTLRQRLNDVALDMIPGVIRSLTDGTATFTEQDDTQATFTKKFSKEIGNLDGIADDLQKWHIFQSIGDRGWVHFTMNRNGVSTRTKITKAHLADDAFVIDEIIPENGKRQTYIG